MPQFIGDASFSITELDQYRVLVTFLEDVRRYARETHDEELIGLACDCYDDLVCARRACR